MTVQYVMYFWFCGLLASECTHPHKQCVGIMQYLSRPQRTSEFTTVIGDKSAGRHKLLSLRIGSLYLSLKPKSKTLV